MLESRTGNREFIWSGLKEKENLDTFIAAIRNAVLEESSFEIKSPVAAEARKVAMNLLAWCSNGVNVDNYYLFTTTLLKEVNQPILSSKKTLLQQRKIMEEILFATVIRKVYSSVVYIFQLADLSLMPILYQHLIDTDFISETFG